MVDEKAIEAVKGYLSEGKSLHNAIQMAAANFPDSKGVEVELAKYFTRGWKSDFLNC